MIVPEQHRHRPLTPRESWDFLTDRDYRILAKNIKTFGDFHNKTDAAMVSWPGVGKVYPIDNRPGARPTSLLQKLEWRFRRLGWISYAT